MPDKFDRYREALVVETNTIWPAEYQGLDAAEKGRIEQALRLEGWVEVEFTVDERGATGDILVTGAEPAGVFDAAATTAVAGWRYLPRVANRRAVAQRTAVTLRFRVER